jgi:hypothetical protein
MAKKRINKEDIAPKGLFDNVIQGAQSSKEKIDMLTASMRALNQVAQTTKKAVGSAKPNDTKSLKDFDELTRRANATAKAKLNIDKQLLNEKAKLNQKQREQNKEIKQTIQATSKLTNEQQKNLGTLQKLEIRNNKLRAIRAKLNLETKRGQRTLKLINAELDKNNAIIRKSGDAMKQQRMNVGNYTSAIRGLRGALAQLGLAFGVFQIARDAFSVIAGFEQATADLASVLGQTKNASGEWGTEMQSLINQAKELGATTRFTAGEMSNLQMELAKLGFPTDDILGMTNAVQQLAGATGSDLAESSSVVGGNLKAFGLEADQAQRVVDVMAKSFSSSSLDMSKFQTAMANVAPTAKAMGLNIEETTAMIGVLVDNQVDASSAGTGLRNMFIELTNKGITYEDAMAQIRNSTNKAKTAFDLFGKKGMTLGLILSENQKAVNTLESGLFQAGGSAETMADTQLDTLNGALALLRSAWEGLLLKFEEGTGVFGMLKEVVLFLANNLETIAKVMITLGAAFGVYRLINMTTKAFKALTIAMNANPFILVASAIAGIVTAIALWTDEMTDAERVAKTLADVQEEATKATQKERAELDTLLAVAQNKNLSDQERIKAIEELNRLSPEYLGNLTLENVTTEEGVRMIDAYVKSLNKKALAQAIAAKKQELYNKMLEAETSAAIENVGFWDAISASISSGQALTGDYVAFLKEANKIGAENRKKEMESIQKEIDALDDLMKKKIESGDLDVSDVLGDDSGGGGGSGDPDPPKTKKKLEDLSRLIRDEQIKRIKDEEAREKAKLEEDYKRAQEDIKKKFAIEDQKDKLLKEKKATFEMEMAEIEKKWRDKRIEAENEAMVNEQKARILGQEMKIAQAKEGSEEELALLEELDQLKIEQLYQNANIQLGAEKITAEEIARITAEREANVTEIELNAIKRRKEFKEKAWAEELAGFDRKEKEKYNELLQSNLDQDELAKARTQMEIESLEEQLRILKEKYPELKDVILDTEIELAEKKRDLKKIEADELKEDLKEQYELQRLAIEGVTNLLVKEIDERIKAIDKEIEAHKKRASELEELAKNGNILAQESLAEENRLIAEAEREREIQERRKQQILLVSSVLQAYNANLEAGQESGEAFRNAVISKAVLDAFIASLGSFYVGTEDTGKASNALDANGGRLAVLHDNERVMTSKQNKMIGNVSNDEVARVMEARRLGKMVEGESQIISFDNQILVNELMTVSEKLDQVNKTIANKPELDVKVGEVSSMAMKITETHKKKGVRTVNTFIVKPK